MKRYSRKRQAIIECLRSTKTHPTAEWVYEQLKPEHPNLSLATVYRNLSQLKDDGVIRSVGTVDGKERFDGCAADHSHIVCSECGRVTDISELSFPADLSEKVSTLTGYSSIGSNLVFSGICPECLFKHDKAGE